MNKTCPDPVAAAFLESEGLELCERVGIALREMAKVTDLEFSDKQLAQPDNTYAFSDFYFALGFNFCPENANRLIEKYPEKADEINEISKKIAVYKKEQQNITTINERDLEPTGVLWGGGWGGHGNPDFGRIINLGTDGIREIIAKGRLDHPESNAFYNGCEYALDAIDILGERAGKLAKELVKTETDPIKKHRLELAAKAFEVVPKKPAYDFTSAVQIFWILFKFEGGDSPGRFDQYMKRAYELSTDREEVLDVLERLWYSFKYARAWNLCISGSDENWNDMSNGLTYDILEMVKKVKCRTPNLTLRVHRNTPDSIWRAAAEALAVGTGLPCIYNDETVCPSLEKLGIPPSDSHNYCMNGCNQIDIMGKSHMGLEDGEVVFAKCLELTLNNGANPMDDAKKIIGIQTGDPRQFKTYDELERAFYRQVDYMTMIATMNANLAQQTRAMYAPNPYRSCMIEGCLEKGIDYRNGGPIYNHGQILAEGIADAGDSLYAIKKLVYDEGKYTMDQLLNALDANFEGYDDLHYDFSACAKFGNDNEEVDAITVKTVNRFFKVLKNIHTYRGGIYTGGCSTFGRAANYGIRIGALPNGKRRGDALLADSSGATPGCDTNGPTALIKSAIKYDQKNAGSGFVLQLKFDKKLFNTEKGLESFINLAKAYFAGGGQNLATNVLSHEELLAAKADPKSHKDLVVRVGGYSDYFVKLDSDLQDNIIARTYHNL